MWLRLSRTRQPAQFSISLHPMSFSRPFKPCSSSCWNFKRDHHRLSRLPKVEKSQELNFNSKVSKQTAEYTSPLIFHSIANSSLAQLVFEEELWSSERCGVHIVESTLWTAWIVRNRSLSLLGQSLVSKIWSGRCWVGLLKALESQSFYD